MLLEIDPLQKKIEESSLYVFGCSAVVKYRMACYILLGI